MPPFSPIILASRSPRRSALLDQIGVEFHVCVPEVDERPRPDEGPRDYVLRIAQAKATEGWGQSRGASASGAPVLAADTAVVVGSTILGKPENREEARRMLSMLSGRTHHVLTGVAVFDGRQCVTTLTDTEVTFGQLSAQDIADYVATGEADDKAGAYAIQGRAGVFVTQIRGSYTGVVGLPLAETYALLRRCGVRTTWNPADGHSKDHSE